MAEEKTFGNVLKKRYEKLKWYYLGTGIKLSFEAFAAAIFLIAVLVFVFLSLLHLSPVTSALAFLAILSIILVIPINVRNSRIAELEENLPDALRHMALVLKAGGTTEAALAEVANAGYGVLSNELKYALKELREGKSFDDVFLERARASGSLLFERTALIVIDAKKAGAGIADVMTEIADDARDISRIKRERYSRTTIHVVFLLAAGLFIAPFIFGFSISIVNYINAGIASALPQAPRTSLCALNTLLSAFVAVQTIIIAVALGIIREGKVVKYVVYAPLMVLCSVLILEAGKWLGTAIVGGVPIIC